MRAKLTKEFIDAQQHQAGMFKVWDSELKGFFLRFAPAPSTRKTFCVFYRADGKGRDYTIGPYGALTPEQARKLAKEELGKVAGGTDIQHARKAKRAKTKAEKVQTLAGFIENKYKPWAQANLRGSAEQLRVLDVDFKEWHGKPLGEITQWTVQSWAAGKRKPSNADQRALKASSINRRITALKSVLSKAAEWGVIESSPLQGMRRLKTDDSAKPRFLSPEEESRLRAALDARQAAQRITREQFNAWRAARHQDPLPLLDDTYTDYLAPMVLLTLNTGLRRGELFNLQWRNVDLARRVLTVAGDGAKSGQTRHIPLNDEAFAVLTAWRNQSAKNATLVFPSPVSGGRLDNIKKAWGELLTTRAKIAGFRFHDLRHTFASNLVMGGIDLNTVRELLGHADIETTLRYAHLAPEHKAAAVAVLGKAKESRPRG